MGLVWKAEDTELGRFVALKSLPASVLDQEHRRARFLREARAASALNHPNIVTVYDLIRGQDSDFLVMEYVDGKTLEHLLHGRGLPLSESLRIGVAIADALTAAHHAGIVHRDLKPGNVMVNTSGAVKVL
ncbi:MAG: serine/threonine protein kinase, partial [Bryobacter sp.]|nr:serine/threonine protein kinase [Bryobacter sp.]